MIVYKQLIAFLFVGGLNTLFGYVLYSIFIYLGMSYPLAVFLATCLGVIFNFKTTGKLVFNNSDNTLFMRFVCVYAVSYLFNTSLIYLLQVMISNLYLSGFIAIIPTAALTFILNKLFVFNRARVEVLPSS